MNQVAAIDASHFSAQNHGVKAPLYWGMVGLILIESIVFGSLVASYFYLRLVAVSWPPAGVEPPKLLLPSLNTLILVASGIVMYSADSAIKRGNLRWLKLGLSIAVALALAFLTLKYVEYSGLDYRWDSHAYGSIVWTIAGFHSAHVITLVLKSVVVLSLAFRNFFSAERYLAVQINGMYWQFVVAVWVPLYGVLYFAPRLLD